MEVSVHKMFVGLFRFKSEHNNPYNSAAWRTLLNHLLIDVSLKMNGNFSWIEFLVIEFGIMHCEPRPTKIKQNTPILIILVTCAGSCFKF